MKFYIAASAFILFVVPHIARAQDAPTFTGAKIGVEASRERASVRRDPGAIGATSTAAKNAIGYRGFVGYDMQLGPVVLGAEAGMGGGGKAVRQTATRGQYLVDPGLTYDLTARAGVVVAPGTLLYGRAGYRWLQTDRTTTPTAGPRLVREQTDGGITYGGGAEVMIDRHFSLRAEYDRTVYDRTLRANKIAVGGVFKF